MAEELEAARILLVAKTARIAEGALPGSGGGSAARRGDSEPGIVGGGGYGAPGTGAEACERGRAGADGATARASPLPAVEG